MMKKFDGKSIYNPSGKAGEYSYWACNFYVGCSNDCSYCYCKKGILAGTMGGNKPTLKKCFKDEKHALNIFEDELILNLSDLRRQGLFFSFSTDPLLPETISVTTIAVSMCAHIRVPVKILTKCVNGANDVLEFLTATDEEPERLDFWKKYVAFGFTLTGHDELEPGASTNQERIDAMKKLHDAGFKTFASIEPIIDFDSSFEMIEATKDFCDLYKIGLESSKKYNELDSMIFVGNVTILCNKTKIYFKDSLLKQAGRLQRSELPSNCVNRDYNMFTNSTRKIDKS